jgi:hypothetical protein
VRATGEHHHGANERGELAGWQVSFSNLHDVDPRIDRITRLVEQTS